ncbi:glutathione S-transferase family protein [Marinibaculum pumilum]|uniref:Glutathione S-transferase family protein n=1 Tax=Marinibaculum pumilum TaxID=1766165 RepID=A0ABV7L2M7_9PROT
MIAAEFLRIFTGPMSVFGAKAVIAAHEKALDFETVMVPFSLRDGYAPKPDEVLQGNPKGQIPVLLHDGLVLFDSTQIFEYLEDRWPRPPLWPTAPAERSLARQAELLADEVLFPRVLTLMGLCRSGAGAQACAPAVAAIGELQRDLDRRLAGRDWLAGPYGYADIATFCVQMMASALGADPGADMSRLTAWRDRVVARPAVARTLAPMAAFMTANRMVLPPWLAAMAAKAGPPEGAMAS